jgi:hypothetical protein
MRSRSGRSFPSTKKGLRDRRRIPLAHVPNRDVQRDAGADQPMEEPASAVRCVNGQPFGLEAQSLVRPLDHRLCRSDLVINTGRRGLHVNDNRVLDVDQVIARDRPPQRSASSDPPQIAAESYSANQIIQCVFTQPGSFSSDRHAPDARGMSASPPRASKRWHRSETTRCAIALNRCAIACGAAGRERCPEGEIVDSGRGALS